MKDTPTQDEAIETQEEVIVKKPRGRPPKDSVEVPAETIAAVSHKIKKPKKFNKKHSDLEKRIVELEGQKALLEGPANRKKRMNLFQQMTRLRKAQGDPENYLIDKKQEIAYEADQRNRRRKKLEQKKARIDAKVAAKIADFKKFKNSQRDRRKQCLFCKKYGHVMGDCTERAASGIKATVCYNCGSEDHAYKECQKPRVKGEDFKFAKCFICMEEGHLAKDCKTNENGI